MHVKSGGSANLTIDHLQSSKGYKIGKMLVVFAGTVSKGVILLDYAAISYMFSDQNLFISYHDLTDSEYITISSEHCISTLGIGSVKMFFSFSC